MTISQSDLLALADRVEALGGPDREVDAAVHVQATYAWPHVRLTDDSAPAYTASLDAALSLVPEGCGWRIWAPAADSDQRHRATIWAARGMPVFSPFDVEASTPALALTAAALRARAAMVQS